MKTNETIVIGGGQAGLAVGYYLSKLGLSFQILDANPRIGDPWRNRWDSLRLFTVARYAGLPGYPFPAASDAFPTKDDVADYLESYARRFRLPVQNGMKVDSVSREGERFVVNAGGRRLEADQVVIAMANYQVPKVPSYASELDRSIVQLHSSQYRNPSQLKPGPVLVVGVGNSGADISMEVVRTHETWLSGKEAGAIPFRIETFLARYIFVRVVRFIFHHVLSTSTPVGRKVRRNERSHTAPLVRVKPQDLVNAGIQRVGRVTGVRAGHPVLDNGRELEVANVIWCTGFYSGFSWVHLPAFNENGLPVHERGIVKNEPGLYFVGLHFLHALTSATLMGIGRDAQFIAKAIQTRVQEKTSVVSRKSDKTLGQVLGKVQVG